MSILPSMSSKTLSATAQLEQAQAALAEEKAINDALRHTNTLLRTEIEELRKELRLLRRKLKQALGSRSDDHLIDKGQLTLFGDAPDPQETTPPPSEHMNEAPDGETPEDRIKERHKPKRPARQVDTSVLPRETVVHELPEAERVCPKTGVPLVPIGEKVTEEIGYTPARLTVIEHHQIEYGPAPEIAAERHIDPIAAPLPPRALEGCMASSDLVAQLLVQKYVFHMPLYRQEEIFQQAGLWIPRQTLCDWVLKAAFALKPIVDALMAMIRAGPVFQLDDTPVKCQGGRGAGVFLAYLWTFVNPEVSGVVYAFTTGRSANDLKPFLEGLEAEIMLGDGYKAHMAAAREAGLSLLLAACWAHVLRAFRDARKEARAMVALFEADIRELYAIEREATELGLDPDERAALRRQKGRPVLARMLWRTHGWKDVFSTSGKMGKAIKYMRNSWTALKTFLLDGRVPLDNNACELAIRPVAVGRKNWLFAGSVRGGEAAAIVYSLVGSCRLAGVDPREYLNDVLVRVATHPASRVAELVPSRWAQLHAAPAAV